jgi:flagellar biosynthesis protein FlhF
MEEAREKDLVFIDTPGAGPAELEWWSAWAPRIASHAEVEFQLVLPATASARQLAFWARLHLPLRPSRLIFTHLDEASGTGSVLASAMETGLPVSFLATGQAIPEDLEPATKPRLLELLFGEPGALSAAA